VAGAAAAAAAATAAAAAANRDADAGADADAGPVSRAGSAADARTESNHRRFTVALQLSQLSELVEGTQRLKNALVRATNIGDPADPVVAEHLADAAAVARALAGAVASALAAANADIAERESF